MPAKGAEIVDRTNRALYEEQLLNFLTPQLIADKNVARIIAAMSYDKVFYVCDHCSTLYHYQSEAVALLSRLSFHNLVHGLRGLQLRGVGWDGPSKQTHSDCAVISVNVRCPRLLSGGTDASLHLYHHGASSVAADTGSKESTCQGAISLKVSCSFTAMVVDGELIAVSEVDDISLSKPTRAQTFSLYRQPAASFSDTETSDDHAESDREVRVDFVTPPRSSVRARSRSRPSGRQLNRELPSFNRREHSAFYA